MIRRARTLRHESTEPEQLLWTALRNGQISGLKFRRQYSIDNYVVDFFCFERRLAVELDGSVHSQPSQIKRDSAKDAYLRSLGIHVLRLPNGLVLEDPERFVRKVRGAAETKGTRGTSRRKRPLTRPPPSGTLSPRERAGDNRRSGGTRTP